MIQPVTNASLAPLLQRRVAVLGYGAQGAAHARNLRDSGVEVLVAQRASSPRHSQALADGFAPVSVEQAVQRAELLIFGLPDEIAPRVFEQQIRPHLRAGQALGFMHGFVMHYCLIKPPPTVDVLLVAPKAQGRAVRLEFEAGRGVLALIAVHQNASGHARELALAWAAGIGAARAGILETTFADETETDLFGEQAVLCGGLSELIRAGFDTLVQAGYAPELAYLECCHELKIIADLIYESGISAMRARISNTARFGDLTRGQRVIGEATRAEMRALLAEIRSGAFAREFLAHAAAPDARVQRREADDRQHALERVGHELRALIFRRDGESAESQTSR